MSDPNKAITAIPAFEFSDISLNVLIDAKTKTPYFIPREVGEAIGYADPAKISERITARWSEDLEEGEDFERFNYAELNAKFQTPQEGGSKFNQRGMILLTEEGLYGVLMLTRAPRSRAFRKWVRSDVLPQIARDGSFSPRREVDPNGVLRIKEGEVEVERLRLQLQLAQLSTASAKSKALEDLTACIPGLGAAAISSLKIRAVELLTGEDLAAFKPRLEAVHTPTSMAHLLGVTPARVGRVITALGLRGEAGMSEAILNTKANSDGHVKTWLYTDAAFDKIKVGVEAWKATQK